MVGISKYAFLKLLFIIGILQYTKEKSILEAKSIYNGRCNNYYGIYSFNISAILKGNLSDSIIDNYKIKVNTLKDNNINIKCNFPEIKSNNGRTREINITCFIKNYVNNDNLTLSFEGENNKLKLINFGRKILNLKKINCEKYVILLLGNINNQKCEESSSLIKYSFKIEILNKTFPENFSLNKVHLNYKSSIGYTKYNSECYLVRDGSSNYLDCYMVIDELLKESLYLDEGIIFEKFDSSNNIRIFFKNKYRRFFEINYNIKSKKGKNENDFPIIILRTMEEEEGNNSIDNMTQISSESLENTEYTSSLIISDSIGNYDNNSENNIIDTNSENNIIDTQSENNIIDISSQFLSESIENIDNIDNNNSDKISSKIDDSTELVENYNISDSISLTDEESTINIENSSNSTLFESDEPIDETPIFIYNYTDDGYCSEDSYIFNIYGNMSNDKNSLLEIELNINVNNQEYNASCNLEKIQNKNTTHKFKCKFTPHQYFNKLEIYPKTNFTNLQILNWENNEVITIDKEYICTKHIINPINFKNLNNCDFDSDTFSFEIEMESSIKKGNIQNQSIILNISRPNFIDEIKCIIINSNLNQSIILICEISDLNQEKRLTDGIFINGVKKSNIFDEYFITEDNEYIKISDLYGAKFNFLECPTLFDIIHCKELNISERQCIKCHRNYYLNEDENQCLTCSQLNTGCSSCDGDGNCTKCLDGFQRNESESECIIEKNCGEDEYGPECKKCNKIDPNCIECSKSGFCLVCDKGYYLSGIDKDSKCIKCLPTCQECESMNKCTKCNEGLLLNNGSCDSCLLYIDGCEKCSQIDRCQKCYNNKLLNYKLNNSNLCEKEKEENNNAKTNLKLERFDNYIKEDNKVNFKLHFLLLDNILYNTKLFLFTNLKMRNIEHSKLRSLEEDILTTNKNITCEQYGDALGSNNKGGYLANYKCSFENDDYEILSIDPINIEIKDNKNKTIQNFEIKDKAIDVNEIESMPLDEEYKNYEFNKFTIKEASNVAFETQLYFNITGDLDSEIAGEEEYEISLRDNYNNTVNATCIFNNVINDLDNQTISCIFSKFYSKFENLAIENGVYSEKNNSNNKLILNINEGTRVSISSNGKTYEKKGVLKTGIIICIVIVGFAILCGISFLIIKFVIKKKDTSGQQNGLIVKGGKGTDNSKDLIL